MARFQPSVPFSVAMILLIPVYDDTLDVIEKVFPLPENGIRINGSFRAYGGTEREVNGLYSVDDTAIIETWYRPDIKADCRIYIPDLDTTYEILGRPEDIELRHQYMKFKVTAYTGGA